MKKKFEDPIGMRYCRSCAELKPLTNDNYSHWGNNAQGFHIYCKVCDNAQRKKRYQDRTSHNIQRFCKICNETFMAELCRVRKGKGIYCSNKCKIIGLHAEKEPGIIWKNT